MVPPAYRPAPGAPVLDVVEALESLPEGLLDVGLIAADEARAHREGERRQFLCDGHRVAFGDRLGQAVLGDVDRALLTKGLADETNPRGSGPENPVDEVVEQLRFRPGKTLRERLHESAKFGFQNFHRVAKI